MLKKITLVIVLSFINTVYSKEVTLTNSLWSISINTKTLAIKATSDQETYYLNYAVMNENTSILEESEQHIRYEIPNLKATVTIRLQESEISLKITSDKTQDFPLLHLKEQPHTKGWIVPFFEGSYIPKKDTIWHQFLTKYHKIGNTVESFTIPMISMDYGKHIAHYIFINPFYNIFGFNINKDNLQFVANHQFSDLDPYTPMELIILIGNNDQLAGAKRYRRFLKNSNSFNNLRDKLANNSSLNLIGASHYYLFGETLISRHNIIDWERFIDILNQETIIQERIKEHFSKNTLDLLQKQKFTINEQDKILSDLDNALNSITVNFDEKVDIIQELFEDTIEDRENWGDGLSSRVLEKLKNAGINRAWLGVQWQDAINHPEAIQAARDTGYFVGIVDSYYTSSNEKKNKNNSHDNSNMGKGIFKKCLIKTKKNKLIKSSKPDEYFVNPQCVNSYMHQRVRLGLDDLGANSWYLDGDGSGLLFEDYNKIQPLSKPKFADSLNSRIKWLTNSFDIPVGSDGGSGVFVEYLAFAHGPFLPFIGFLENDAPKHFSPINPKKFFLTKEASPMLKHIYFNPKNRIPLYQAVFHDSIISSNHWYNDNLTYKEELVTTAMLQALYNVAPLFYVNQANIDERLPLMKKLHMFFHKCHRNLYSKELLKFSFLSEDKLCQKTLFSDKSEIVANFKESAFEYRGVTIKPKSVVAILPGQAIRTLEFSNWSYSSEKKKL